MPSWVLQNLFSLVVGLCIALWPAQLLGHSVDQVFMEFSAQEDQIYGVMYLDAAYCLPEYRGDDSMTAPTRQWLVGLDEEEHARLRLEAEAYIRDALVIMVEQAPVAYSVRFPDYAQVPYDFYPSVINKPVLRAQIQADYPDYGGALQVGWRDPYEAKLLLDFHWVDEGGPQKSLLQIDAMSAIDTGFITEAVVRSEAEQQVLPRSRSVGGFIGVGFRHILPLGLDHILFIVGIFLFLPHWRPLLTQSLCFTAAHSVTLALALLGVVSFDSQWVEVLIALSIVYIAVENLWGESGQVRRLCLIVAFGLLHGLGFGSVLQQYLPTERVFWPLLQFNLGVELGQITILAGCFLLYFPFKKWFKEWRKYCSLLIGLIGLYWVVERILN